VAIVMDGNGRWAERRGRPRTTGHVAGARTAKAVVAAARKAGVRTLTLYAFSSDNWRRPPREVGSLLRLLRRTLLAETARCIANGIRLTVVGRRDRLPEALRMAIEGAEAATAGGTALHLRVAIDYSARDAILRAAARLADADGPVADRWTRDRFAAALSAVDHDPVAPVPVDLLIRTGGEHRLSDFLLWECAYAELLFVPTPWPDFDGAAFEGALAEFACRQRRFGGVTVAARA
jgi:undecaprenyl diphosphate synthase